MGQFWVQFNSSDFQGGDIEVATVDYEIVNDTAFTAKGQTGWIHSARYCVQASLPLEWRHTDIGDSL